MHEGVFLGRVTSEVFSVVLQGKPDEKLASVHFWVAADPVTTVEAGARGEDMELDQMTCIYHMSSYHIISYHIISYHIISYHIISYHIISHHISYDISYIM